MSTSSIHVSDDHDGFEEGDGEIILNMIINGKRLQLLNRGEDLGDGSDMSFSSKAVTINLPSHGTLHIASDQANSCESDENQNLGC